MSFRYRYYAQSKDSVISNIKSAIDNLENLFSQEAEHIVSTDLIEVEGLNTISCPPHFVQLIHAIKLLKQIEERVEHGCFISLEKKED